MPFPAARRDRIPSVRLMLAALLAAAGCTDNGSAPGAGAPADAGARTPHTLSAPVEVLVDDWGNSHIYAESKLDASFAQCYRAAHDRLLQMDYLIRNVTGRLSEWFGEDMLDADRQRRVIGFERIGRETWEWLQTEHPGTAGRVGACTDGINAYIDDAKAGRNGARFHRGFDAIDPDYVPPRVEPHWVVAFAKGQAFELSFGGEIEFAIWLLQRVLGPETFADILQFQPMLRGYILDPEDRARYGLDPLPGGRLDEAPWPAPAARAPAPAAPAPDALPLDLAPAVLTGVAEAFETLRPLGSPASRGSNNWVVHGDLTDTGRPILADDPHLGLDLPANFLETHLVYPEDGETVNIQGIMLAGGPGVLIGHNDHVAWGLTTTFGDVTDLYLETLSEDGTRYRAGDGTWQPLEIAFEPICVRPEGGAVADCRELPFEVRIVPGHGPLMNDLLGAVGDVLPPISVRWTGFEPTAELAAIDAINGARDVAEAQRDLELFHVGQQNFVLMDSAGDIGYIAPALLPLRDWDLGVDPPYRPLPADGDHEWAGFKDYSRVPRTVNPDKGYLVTANNDPFGTTDDGDPTNDALYFGHFYSSGFRAEQIRRRIEQATAPGTAMTFAEMQSIQADVTSILAQQSLPHLLAAAPADCATPSPAAPRRCRAIDLLRAWNYESSLTSAAPTLFHLWYAHLARETFADDLPLWGVITDLFGASGIEAYGRPLKTLLDGGELPSGRDYFDRSDTPAVETRDEIILDALDAALDQAGAAFTDATGAPLPLTRWTWNRFHVVEFQHHIHELAPELTRGPFPNDGGRQNPDASEWALFDGGRVVGPDTGAVQRGGPNMRMVVTHDPAGGWRMENVLPGGASGDPDSPHYDDQLDLWLANEARAIPFTRDEVEAVAERRLTLPPGFPDSGAVEDRAFVR